MDTPQVYVRKNIIAGDILHIMWKSPLLNDDNDDDVVRIQNSTTTYELKEI